jgi:hypothetical protein
MEHVGAGRQRAKRFVDGSLPGATVKVERRVWDHHGHGGVDQ